MGCTAASVLFICCFLIRVEGIVVETLCIHCMYELPSCEGEPLLQELCAHNNDRHSDAESHSYDMEMYTFRLFVICELFFSVFLVSIRDGQGALARDLPEFY